MDILIIIIFNVTDPCELLKFTYGNFLPSSSCTTDSVSCDGEIRTRTRIEKYQVGKPCSPRKNVTLEKGSTDPFPTQSRSDLHQFSLIFPTHK